MVLHFRGTAHPPAGISSPNISNLTDVEVSLTDVSNNGGIPLLYEHNEASKIGQCEASWQGTKGELRVSGRIDDASIEKAVRSGSNRVLLTSP